MKKLFIILILLLLPFFVFAKYNISLSKRFSGYILLDVEKNGEAWYVFPKNKKRYYLGRPEDAWKIMSELSIGINKADLIRIKTGQVPQRLIGYILINTEDLGKAYYLNPGDSKLYYLGGPLDAWKIMTKLGAGISHHELSMIHKPGINESIDAYSSYYKKIIKLDDGRRSRVDVIEVSLANPRLRIFTETADNYNCQNNCNADYLANYVLKNNGFAGVVGTYFDAGGPTNNYYFFPVYNTREKIMINKDELKYEDTGPVMVFTDDNYVYYFDNSQEFEKKLSSNKAGKFSLALADGSSKLVQAAIGNKPALLKDDSYYHHLEKKEVTKNSRIALAYKDVKIYIIFARNASILDLNKILRKMKMDFAVNLDAGGSSALYYNSEYVIGPGRSTPNAIVFSEEPDRESKVLGVKVFSANSNFLLLSF